MRSVEIIELLEGALQMTQQTHAQGRLAGTPRRAPGQDRDPHGGIFGRWSGRKPLQTTTPKHLQMAVMRDGRGGVAVRPLQGSFKAPTIPFPTLSLASTAHALRA